MPVWSGGRDQELIELVDALISGTRAGTIKWRSDAHGTYSYQGDSGRIDLAGVESRGLVVSPGVGYWHRLVVMDREGEEVDRVEAGLGRLGMTGGDPLAFKLHELYELVNTDRASARAVTRDLIAEISGRTGT